MKKNQKFKTKNDGIIDIEDVLSVHPKMTIATGGSGYCIPFNAEIFQYFSIDIFLTGNKKITLSHKEAENFCKIYNKK